MPEFRSIEHIGIKTIVARLNRCARAHAELRTERRMLYDARLEHAVTDAMLCYGVEEVEAALAAGEDVTDLARKLCETYRLREGAGDLPDPPNAIRLVTSPRA